MDDLLKDAIADAKAVRETALANAKVALEEAFTPRIQSMLSQKIQSEIEDEEPKAHDEEEDNDNPVDINIDADGKEDEPEVAAEPEVGEDEIANADEEEVPHDEEEVPHDEEEVPHDEIGDADEGEYNEEEEPAAHDEEEDVIEINGVKYAPVVSEEEEEDADEMKYEEEEVDEDELDLESILKELEDEADEGEDKMDEEYDENAVGDGHNSDEVETADEAELAENDVSSDIGKADNKVNDEAGDASDIGAPGPEGEGSKSEQGKEDDNLEVVDDLVEVNGVRYKKVQEEEGEAHDEDDDIDLEEILKALSEEEDKDENEEKAEEQISKLTSELDEHRSVVKYLRGKLNEVNLLNAKLLFTNKLFRAHGLNNEQKLKVVETFDRAKNLREVKLVFATLAESFGNQKANASKPIKESKGSASKAVASTKPKSSPKVIEEGMDLKARFQKLANIL
jgi:hypothetical protein